MTKFISYIRVSTQRQGDSGLGLEAQQKMIADYIARDGGRLVGEFREIESGKSHRNRPELRKALQSARRHKGTLIVAKLDRLARNVAFVSTLLETPGVEFKAADFPDANRMLIQLLAVFAEYERQQISERTKAALAARRARGLPLGNPQNLVPGCSPAPALNAAAAAATAARLRPVIEAIQAEGVHTVRGIADELNRRGYVTERGAGYHATTVARVLGRL